MLNDVFVTQSSPILVTLTSNQKRIMRKRIFSFRIMFSHRSPRRFGTTDHEPIHSLDQAFFLLNREDSPPSSTSRAQAAPAVMNQTIIFFEIPQPYSTNSRGRSSSRARSPLQQATP